MNPHKIALCITDLHCGGAERTLAELAIRLDRERFAPVVYCLADPPDNPARSLLPLLQSAGVPVHCLGASGNWQFLAVLRRLVVLLKQQGPELLQCFLFHANLLGRIAARLAGVPHVVCSIRVAEREHRWHLWLDRLSDHLVQQHVCVSQAVAQFSAKVGRLPPQKLVVIPNGVDCARLAAARAADLTMFGIPPGCRAVVSIGRLEPQKGFQWLLLHAGQWLDVLADCHLLIVGDGPLRPALLRLVQRLGEVGQKVHLAGWRAEVPEILAASSLLVLASRWEGMPNVVLEAMAAGLPVVATDVEGVRELLGPDAQRQTAPPDDPQQFAQKIIAILSNPVLANELGEANRHRAVQQFSIQRMVDRYQQLWAQLLPTRFGRTPRLSG